MAESELQSKSLQTPRRHFDIRRQPLVRAACRPYDPGNSRITRGGDPRRRRGLAFCRLGIEGEHLALAAGRHQRRRHCRRYVTPARTETETVSVFRRNRFARPQAAGHDERGLIRTERVLAAHLRIEAGFAQLDDDGRHNLVVHALGCALAAFMHRISADFSLKSRRVAAIDCDHVGRDREIRNQDDARFLRAGRA